MLRKDPRRSTAERAILGFLAEHYEPPGSTYLEMIEGMAKGSQAEPKWKGLGIRQVKRYLPEFQKEKWVSGKLVGLSQRFSITRDGYFHYHKSLGHDVGSLEVIPEELMPPLIAKGIWRLTQDQTRYFKEYLGQKGSLLVLLPAGAGKTLIAMMEAYQHYREAPDMGSKVLYVSPYKAINSQSTEEFKRVLQPLGVRIARQDGDHHTPREELLMANIVVSTFESAQYSLYRRDEWTRQVALVIVDELNILDATRDAGREGSKMLPRGANLDLLITSFLHSFGEAGRKVKFVCLGIPNASQPALQKWFGNGTTILNPSKRFERCEEKVAVFEQSETGEEWHLERKDGVLSSGPYKVPLSSDMQRMLIVVIHYLRDLYTSSKDGRIKPVLVFVRGRKDASECALRLQELVAKDPSLGKEMRKGRPGNSYRVDRSVIIPTSTVKQLSRVVDSGIGFHHAGLFHAQRNVVEEMMNDGSLSVLFATTTLTHGVDFPVGAVIIDVEMIRDILRYSRLEYLQLKGRVDHKDPFHETDGMADAIVVMSQGKSVEEYERVRGLLQGVDPPLDPFPLIPPNSGTFMLRIVQYLISQSRTASLEQLTGFAKRTYSVQHELQGTRPTIASTIEGDVQKQSEGIIHWCHRMGLIRRQQDGFTLGDLGEVANKTGIGFLDASIISERIKHLLSSTPDKLHVRLLSLALAMVESSEVNEVLPRVRLYERVPASLRKETKLLMRVGLGLQQGVLGAIIRNWMEEKPVPEVVFDRPYIQAYESGLLISIRAVARNIRKIAHVMEILGANSSSIAEAGTYQELARTAKLMATRVRYGVKHDIASSELGTLASRVDIDDLVNSQGYPEFLMRITLRLMMEKGWSTTAKLQEYNGKKPITVADLRGSNLDKETADCVKAHRDKVNEVALKIIDLAKSDGMSNHVDLIRAV